MTLCGLLFVKILTQYLSRGISAGNTSKPHDVGVCFGFQPYARIQTRMVVRYPTAALGYISRRSACLCRIWASSERCCRLHPPQIPATEHLGCTRSFEVRKLAISHRQKRLIWPKKPVHASMFSIFPPPRRPTCSPIK